MSDSRTLPLAHFLASGAVVDNTTHQVRATCATREDGEDVTTFEFRVGHRPPRPLDWGWGGTRLDHTWWFLADTADEVAAALRQPDSSQVVILAGSDYEHATQDDLLQMSYGFHGGNFSFTTGNLIGSVTGFGGGGKNYTLKISSRFGDEFLKYIISDADGFVEIANRGGTSGDDYRWLLIYVWLAKLRKALRLGLPKAYEARNERLTTVRGRLDPVDYSRHSRLGHYRCDFREHSYDNSATRLIARTLCQLRGEPLLDDCHALDQTFQSATGGRSHPLSELLAAKPLANPYFADYRPVVALAKQILRNQSIGFGSPNRTSALLFDVSMLFEYFIRKLLQRAGVALQPKDDQRWTIPSGLASGPTRRRLIPDLVFEHHDGTYVFDVKYKSFDFDHGVRREDLLQIHTYIGQLANEGPVAGCGFIYPVRGSRWHAHGLNACQGIVSDTILQGGHPVPFHVVFLKVPEKGDFPEDEWPAAFRADFRKAASAMVEDLLNRLSGTSPPSPLEISREILSGYTTPPQRPFSN